MTARTSIYVEGFSHKNPMQAALEGEKLLECDFISVLGRAD